MIDIDESAVDITFNPTTESTILKEADQTAGIGAGVSFDVTKDETVFDKTAPLSEDDTGKRTFLIN